MTQASRLFIKERRQYRQRGQAMTEFIVVTMMVLAPLYLIIPVLGKHIDMKAAAVVGARYAAWERTVFFGGATASVDWPGVEKTDDQIRNEVRQRVFMAKTKVDTADANKLNGVPISNGDKSASAWSVSGFRAAWQNHNKSLMLPDYNTARQTLNQAQSPGVANDVIAVVVKIADALGPFTLEFKGLHTAEVALDATTTPINFTGNSANAFNPGPLTFGDKNAILVNTWNANGRDHVKQQTQGLTPTGVFQTTTGQVLLTVMKAVIGVAMPEIWFLELGKIEPDVVPEDRLVK